MNKIKTDFLIPSDSFVLGFGSILNLGGSYYRYNVSKNEEEADRVAISQDWLKVGQDLDEVVRSQTKELLHSSGE